MHVACQNCYFKGEVEVPVGEPIRSWIASNSCPSCKCFHLQKAWPEQTNSALRELNGFSLRDGNTPSQPF